MRIWNLFLLFLLIHFPFGCKSKFWRRRWHSSVIARDWLYIDGGQVSFTQGNYVRQNSTIGIDLSKDWTNTNLTPFYTERPSGLYARSSQALWHDDERNVIYCFGGDNPVKEQFAPAPTDSVQRFTPDGNGGGDWAEVLGFVGQKPFPSNIHGTSSGMFANDEKDAYYAGGFISQTTSPSVSVGEYSNYGLLRLNFEAITLKNSSSLGLSFTRGAMLNIPIYGSQGVLLAFGGSDDGEIIGLNVINVFDKKEQKWYQQFADGDVPRPRELFCAVVVYGKEHTSVEIIIHGGIVDFTIGPDSQKLDEVYVLSLPAFRWFRANSTSGFPRMAHTCHATKTRQMIMIGGTNPLFSSSYYVDGDLGGEPQDPWDQGIGIFDMTSLQFKESYQARTDPYEPPYVIRQYYNSSNNKYPSSWTSPAVKAIFEDKPLQITPNTTSIPSVSPASFSPRSRSHLGRSALAGLIVGCIIGGLLGVVVVVYMIRKGRRRKKGRTELPADGAATSQATSNYRVPHELSTQREPREIMTERSDRAELSDSWIKPPVEMDTHRASNLDLFLRT